MKKYKSSYGYSNYLMMGFFSVVFILSIGMMLFLYLEGKSIGGLPIMSIVFGLASYFQCRRFSTSYTFMKDGLAIKSANRSYWVPYTDCISIQKLKINQGYKYGLRKGYQRAENDSEVFLITYRGGEKEENKILISPTPQEEFAQDFLYYTEKRAGYNL